ncbi:MFS transporter [Pseudomonas aeruginosa]|nr:MFS transporter [Pseudomonas aeruginosa]
MFRQNRWLVLAIVSSALFLIIIDMTVLYTALPRLTHDLGATAAEKLWIVNAYPLVVAGLLPGAGLLSDRLGHSGCSSPACRCSAWPRCAPPSPPSAAALIAARAGLAVGAALMMPATLSIVRHVFQDERERALAIGIWASVASAGAALRGRWSAACCWSSSGGARCSSSTSRWWSSLCCWRCRPSRPAAASRGAHGTPSARCR